MTPCCSRHQMWGTAMAGPCGPLSPGDVRTILAVAQEVQDQPDVNQGRHHRLLALLAVATVALASDLTSAHSSLGQMTAHRDALLRAFEHAKDELRTLRSPA